MSLFTHSTAHIDAILDQIGGVGVMPKCAKLFRLASTVWLLSLGNALTASAAELLQLPPAPNIPIQRYGERYKLCLSWITYRIFRTFRIAGFL
jgi:hypothetical protein